MRASLCLAVLLAACAHGGHQGSRLEQAHVPLATSAADAVFEAGMAELAAARFQSAGALFKEFADRFPTDPRVSTARLHEAYAALNQLDQVRGLDEAQEILAQLVPSPADSVAVQQLQTLILARAQALQTQAAAAELLTQCQGQAGSAVDRERAQSRSQVGKLQQELQRREETLEQVKERLLQIQRMASDVLGAPGSAQVEPDAGLIQ